jgi:cytochrome P450
MASRSISAFAESVTVAELEMDPYPIYARLRQEAPVCFIPAVGLWFVTRYDDVEFVGAHPELFSAQLDDSPVDRTFGSPTIITVDGELHRELRRALDTKYRPRHVNAGQPNHPHNAADRAVEMAILEGEPRSSAAHISFAGTPSFRL